MKLDLSDLLKSPGTSFKFHMEEEVELEGVKLIAPLIADFAFENTGKTLVIDAQVETKVLLQCSRCLEDFPFPIHPHFQESFTNEQLKLDIHGNLITREEEVVSVFEGHVLDLTEFLRQNMIINLPLMPLCSLDCKGLCPICGKNLNEGECQCDKKKVDPRWQKLLNYKQKGGKKSGQS